eukprot:4491220-Amphidinium_carterae.1
MPVQNELSSYDAASRVRSGLESRTISLLRKLRRARSARAIKVGREYFANSCSSLILDRLKALLFSPTTRLMKPRYADLKRWCSFSVSAGATAMFCIK